MLNAFEGRVCTVVSIDSAFGGCEREIVLKSGTYTWPDTSLIRS